jgi:shikimate kinase
MTRSFANIALIGMMGSGKSVVGYLLAEQLGWRFVDIDALIVTAEGKPIADIFAHSGEESFRRIEARTVREVASLEGQVIATGGGAVLRPENREALWGRCWVVWLTATPEEHAARSLRGERRPVLDRHDDRLEAVRRILAERTPLYELADHVEPTSGRSVEEIADSLARRFRSRPGSS